VSIIKLSSGKSSIAMIKYCSMGKLQQKKEIITERCTTWTNSLGLEKPEQLEDAWSITREGFGKNGGIQYHHASLSLDPSDKMTSKISDDELTKMAESFVIKHAPGHDYAVFIHRDKEHPHAHIIWNAVNHETGKKFHSSKDDLKKALEIKDSLDLEFGLKITERAKRPDVISDKVKRLHERNPDTYIWTEDLKSRLENAISSSTNFEDFSSKLVEDGVKSNPRGKNGSITYSFLDANGTERKCRETRLGTDYERDRIEQLLKTNREQFKSIAEQHQLTEKSPRTWNGNKTSERTDRLSPRDSGRDSQDAWPHRDGAKDDRTRMEPEIRRVVQENGGLEGTGITVKDIFERYFPTDGRIKLPTHRTTERNYFEDAGSSGNSRKTYDVGNIRNDKASENNTHLYGHTAYNSNSSSSDNHVKQIKFAIKELENAPSLRQYLEVKRERDSRISTNEQGRVDRNDQTHKSELVRHYCRVDYESQAANTDCQRKFRRSAETVRGISKELLEKAVRRIKAIRDSANAFIEEFGSLRSKIHEHEQHADKHNRDSQSLEDLIGTTQRELKIPTKVIKVSKNRSPGQGIGM